MEVVRIDPNIEKQKSDRIRQQKRAKKLAGNKELDDGNNWKLGKYSKKCIPGLNEEARKRLTGEKQ